MLGIIAVVIGIIIGSSLNNLAISIIFSILGLISIIASFLFIIKQYERSIILRLGKYNRQAVRGCVPDSLLLKLFWLLKLEKK